MPESNSNINDEVNVQHQFISTQQRPAVLQKFRTVSYRVPLSSALYRTVPYRVIIFVYRTVPLPPEVYSIPSREIPSR